MTECALVRIRDQHSTLLEPYANCKIPSPSKEGKSQFHNDHDCIHHTTQLDSTAKHSKNKTIGGQHKQKHARSFFCQRKMHKSEQETSPKQSTSNTLIVDGKSLVAGFVSGGLTNALLHPLDSVKTRLQGI